MRKWWRWLFAFMVLVITSAITFWSLSKLYPEICQGSAQTGNNNCSGYEIAVAFGHWINGFSPAIQIVTAIIMAAFTVVLAKVGRLQVRVYTRQAILMRRQSKIMENQVDLTHRLERAYVFAKVDVVKHETIRIVFSNHGKTPAWIKNIQGAITLLPVTPRPEETKVLKQEDFPVGLVVAPGSDWGTNPQIFKPTPEGFALIQAGTYTFYCMGVIEYIDISGKSRETGFCWHLDVEKDVFLITSGTKSLNYQN